VSRFFKEAAAAALAAAPESEEIRLFLTCLLKDPNRCIDHIWEGYLARGHKDEAAARLGFIKNLVLVFCASMNAEDAATVLDLTRKLKRYTDRGYSALGEALADETVAVEEKLRLLENARKTVCAEATFAKKKHALLRWHIRSDRGGTRARTAFMRAASALFYKETAEWHDEWVADLATAVFPKLNTTIEMVISARRTARNR
jgi:hypothetical protein